MRRLLDGDRFPASEQRLHLALDAAQMGIFEWDIERDHFAWMHLHAGLFGVPSAQFGQNYLAFEQRMHPHDRAETSASIQIAIKTRENFRHEYRVLWSDGSEHWQEIRARLSPGNQSQPARLTGVVFNITDAKTAEQSIKQRQAQLAQLTRVATMGQMASGLAHELTQPLGAILNYAGACMVQMPNRSDIPAEIIKSIGEVITETRRAGAICSRMRLFVRNHLPRCAPVQMNTVVNESLKMMDWELRTRTIHCRWSLAMRFRFSRCW
jgi:PAS domain S-box-containing protein